MMILRYYRNISTRLTACLYTYTCVYSPPTAGSMISSQCQLQAGPPIYNNGYLSSPNYPEKYHRDAHCAWQLAVQEHQGIRVTLFDFELDVKKKGECVDYLEITSESSTAADDVIVPSDDKDSSSRRVSHFKDCGAQGRQQINIESTHALVTFHTDLSSLTERGFLIYFEGSYLFLSIFAFEDTHV